MKYWEIFRFEFTYQLRRVTTWLCFVILFAFGFWMMWGPKLTDEDQFLFSPFAIAFATVFGGLIWLLIAASVAGEAAARDIQERMHPLTYTAPVSKAAYLGGRFLAAFVLNALILVAVPAGILLALLLFDFEPSRLSPFRPAAYITSYGFIALPFVFVATAIQFSGATLSRRTMSSYVASVLLFVTSTFASWHVARLLERWELVAQHLARWELMMLLDLVGFGGIMLNLSDTWTAAEKNTHLVGLEGTVLANRLICLAIAAGVLAFTYHRCRLAHPAEANWRSRAARRKDGSSATTGRSEVERSTSINVPQVRLSFGFATYARQTMGIAWASFRDVAKSRSGLVLLVAIPAVVVVALPDNMEHLGVPLLPRTWHVLTLLTPSLTNPFTPWVVVPLLIVLYAGDLVWRERDADLGEITDAMPMSEWVAFLGKFLGLGLVLGVFMALLTTAGMLAQLILGYHDFEIELYLRVLFGLQLPEYLLFASLALAVHALVNHKYGGHLVALVAYGYIAFASILGIEHNLLIYGSSPSWTYADIRGFGPSLGPWLLLKLYWTAWALLLAVVTRLLWVRGREGRLRARLQLARRRITRRSASGAAAAMGLIVGLGGFIFYNTNVLNDYVTTADRIKWRAEYERRYGQYKNVPQPRLTGIDLHVEMYPERRSAEIRGSYSLVNNTAVPIDSIHLATAPGVETGAVTFDRPAASVLADEDLHHRIYALARPLQPGDSLRLSLKVHVESRGFRNSGIDASIVANGTFSTHKEWLPAVGYRPGRELSDAGKRRMHGLPPRPRIPSIFDLAARRDVNGRERIAFEAVVGTNFDQTAVAAGALRRTWIENGRRYFHYAADDPIANTGVFLSANYAVREARWEASDSSGQEIAIQILHHPEHSANLDRLLRSVRASLDYYTGQFGAYAYRHIKLVERPDSDVGATAYPGTITYGEGFGLFNPEHDPLGIDFPFAVMAHEVAHQWWGFQLPPAGVEGSGLLAESLAWYSAYQVVEETYGPEHLRRLLSLMQNTYQIPRTRAAVPLLRAAGWYLLYRKGPFAMYALSRYIGRERVNGALRRLLDEHGSGAPPLATTLDLYRELQAATPDSLQYLLHDLFEANTFWELETSAAAAEQTAAGTWQVTLDVRARKVVVDSAGVETEVPMDDLVEIGVFAPAAEGETLGEPLYRHMHRIRSDVQTVTVTVPGRPARAGIDPYHLLIDIKMDDNIDEVKIES